MDDEHLFEKFSELLLALNRIVAQVREAGRVQPTIERWAKWKVEELVDSETGAQPVRSKLVEFERVEWWSGTMVVLEQLNSHATYLAFVEKLNSLAGNADGLRELRTALSYWIQLRFKDGTLDPREAFQGLMKVIRKEPISAWIEIDVFGMGLGVQNIVLPFESGRVVFRQFTPVDFEEEFRTGVGPNSRERFVPPPGCIVRIERLASRAWDLQRAATKLLTLIRLAKVWPIDFGQQTLGSSNSYPLTNLCGVFRSSRTHKTGLPTTLKGLSEDNLRVFIERFAVRLPAELHDSEAKRAGPLAIAYERYCEGLLAVGPIERKFAAAIMGLEALYLGASENQELNYRLSLRISKVLSKLGRDPNEVQKYVKTGYRVRSLHVHGSGVDAKERQKIEKAGGKIEDLAVRLLDYLRISILHLIDSKQDKDEFLELVDRSFVYRDADDRLEEMLKEESATLTSALL